MNPWVASDDLFVVLYILMINVSILLDRFWIIFLRRVSGQSKCNPCQRKIDENSKKAFSMAKKGGI